MESLAVAQEEYQDAIVAKSSFADTLKSEVDRAIEATHKSNEPRLAEVNQRISDRLQQLKDTAQNIFPISAQVTGTFYLSPSQSPGIDSVPYEKFGHVYKLQGEVVELNGAVDPLARIQVYFVRDGLVFFNFLDQVTLDFLPEQQS